MAIKKVEDKTFTQKVIDSSQPVVVAFCASWCNEVCITEDDLEKVAKDHQYVKVARMNTDENEETRRKYEIEGVPRVILFGGKEKKKYPVATEIGRMTAEDINRFIEDNLPGP